MEIPDLCRGGGTSDPQPEIKRSGSPVPSCDSLKSEWSITEPISFSSGGVSDSGPEIKRSGSPVPSCDSLKSEWSITEPISFSTGGVSDSGKLSEETPQKKTTNGHTTGVGHLLDSYQPVNSLLQIVSKRHQSIMRNKYESLFEGNKTEENKTLLNRIYTQLYILDGESEGVNEEHEVLHMEKTSRKYLQDTPVNCVDIFKPVQGPEGDAQEGNIISVKAKGVNHRKTRENGEAKQKNLRAVLTKGVAGIGKTVSVQKFILDWAEGEANQDVDFIFVLPFRELNLIKDDQFSLHGLLCDFHPEIKALDPRIYDDLKTVFIFDGLDESRIPLNFEECEKVSDITMTSSVEALIVNLIRGDLLPSAQIWITSRPAAANQIPPQHIDRVTEIQGFSDPQKEEYFRKRISDEEQAERIISHVKKARSLHIMCHNPVFCWISATVLQRIIREDLTEIPQTLTEMYSHFLLTQIHMKSEKFEEKQEKDPKKLLESNRSMLLKLAELAFKQLMKGNVMFYEEDLRECGIDVIEASVCSGIFTEIFREECVLYQRKVFCFVHLSFQEFLAALYVFHCFESKNIVSIPFLHARLKNLNITLDSLLILAVEKAIRSESGHLDLFLRFLLGISLESNQKLLQGLLTQTHSSSDKTTQYIKKLIKRDENEFAFSAEGSNRSFSTESSINLFLCLSEMKDQSLSREIQEYLRSEKHSEENLSPGECSAIAYMILTDEEFLDELDLKKFNTSEEGYRRLIPAVGVCRNALLAGCYLTKKSCETLCSVLQSANSLKELDLSNNNIQDSGVELLSAGLESPHCKLGTLRLSFCSLGENACESLGSALQSVNCLLKELDLSNNDLQDSGMEMLCAGLRSSHCKLEILRLSGCMITEEGCSSLASALQSNPSHLGELDLTYNHPGESGVKLFSDILEDPQCRLEKLQMEHGGRIRMKPGLKKYACELTLDPNTAHTRLSLSEGNRKVKCVKEEQPYPDHPDRFDFYLQVLGRESLTGRCYWEAERWTECSDGAVDIAASYKGVSSKGAGDECQFGYSQHSWSLICSNYRFSFCHNKEFTAVRYPPSDSSRIGVYVDWPAGILSFYSVSQTLDHLHTHHSMFSEPLYAGFTVYYNSSLCVCQTEEPVHSI